MTYGILSAMPEEISLIISSLKNKTVENHGNRDYYSGKLFGYNVVAVFSRWGKVAAATTTTHMILKYKVDKIIFSGIAGAISTELNIGDVVIADRLFQHDMDTRPIMKQFEIPLTKKTFFSIENNDIEMLKTAINNVFDNNNEFKKILIKSNITKPKFVVGNIATGDLFVSNANMRKALKEKLPSAICTEMEGAAVAQVCYDYNVSLCIFRVISDSADELARDNINNFIQENAKHYSLEILKEYFTLISK